MNTIKKLDHDYMDIVPCNCCLLEIFPIMDKDRQSRDTIFMGTYDGHLHAMRLEIEVASNEEKYILVNTKKWMFSYPIMSLINFDMYNCLNDPDAIKSRGGNVFGLSKAKSYNKNLSTLGSNFSERQ